ncbi:hypothetical protein K2Z83_18485 [Oscillochloris sp. ZM17-4]|uniref:hypothetical protein n=1 Tax=Oscillochloris sp. ZM17-4 TaxID=2866714 RepID=UPI001C732B92|nr:hypothetical protein [Oscillochloris sp. ZM17-4]MBX0329662.1 hypothetical protein [Oscillochloris sp. ZM17-4]
MSDVQSIVSPDGRYALQLEHVEMRMSHWVMGATLWERAAQRLVLRIGDGLWSSEQIAWSADSQMVTVGLRRYPGDVPGLVIDIYPGRQIVIPRAPAEEAPLRFAELNPFLERHRVNHRQERR